MSSRLFAPAIAVLVSVALVSGCSLFDSQEGAPAVTSSPTLPPSPTASVTPDAATATPESREPTFAPDGRTGIAELDDLIDALLSADAREIVVRFASVAFGRLTIRALDAEGRAADLPPEEWSEILAASRRSLFAVVRADPNEFPRREYNVVLQLNDSEYWNLAVRGSTVVEIVRRDEAVLTYPTGEPGFEYTGQANEFRLPSIERLPERYLVLPPPNYLPQPPAGHALSVRTGDAGVDALLALLAARDAPGMAARIADYAINRQCRRNPEALIDSSVGAGFTDAWSTEVVAQAESIYAVVDLPEGYYPAAQHLLILVVRRGQYWWETQGILETNGSIVAIISPAWKIDSPPPAGLVIDGPVLNYRECLPLPPAAYVVPPPTGGLDGLDPARRAGIPLVDAILDALQAGDAAALDALTDYTQVACVKLGPNFGQGEIGPACRDDELEGTLIDAIPVGVCHGGWLRREDDLISGPRGGEDQVALYAIVDAGGMVLATPDGYSEHWSLSDRGLRAISRRCGDNHPDRLIGGNDTQYLLAPP